MRRFTKTFLSVIGVLLLGLVFSIPNSEKNSSVFEFIINTYKDESTLMSVTNAKLNLVREEAIEAIQNLAVEHDELITYTPYMISKVESALNEFRIIDNAQEETVAYKSRGNVVVQGLGQMQMATSAVTTEVIQGDVDGNGVVNSDDAIRVLYHALKPEQYTVNQECDFDGDGDVDSNDAIYLLYYTIAPDKYPLASPYKGDISWYNDKENTFVIRTVDQFYGFASLVNSGRDFTEKTVKLGNDIVLNMGDASDWATVAPENEWEPIGTTDAPFSGTFDGQAYSIKGIYVNTSESYSGLFGVTSTDSCIKNFRLENSYIRTFNEDSVVCGTGSVVAELRGKLDTVYSDALLSSEGVHIGGLVGRVNGVNSTSVTIHNCCFDGQLNMVGANAKCGGGVAGATIQGEVTFENCCNYGIISADTAGSEYLGGLLGSNIDAREVHAVRFLHSGQINEAEEGQPHVGLLAGRWCANGSLSNIEMIYVVGEMGTPLLGDTLFDGTLVGDGKEYWFTKEDLSGEAGYCNTMLDFYNYWTARVDDTPALKSFVREEEVYDLTNYIIADRSWYDENLDTFVIRNVNELYAFADFVDYGIDFQNKTIRLANDIIINSGDANEWGEIPPIYSWNPIGTNIFRFKGTFDGQGHSIQGLYCKDEMHDVALFDSVEGCTIKNVSLLNSFLSAPWNGAFLGSFVAYGQGTFESVYSNAILESPSNFVGGLIGFMKKGGISGEEQSQCTISNCWFDGKIIGVEYEAAGFVAEVRYTDVTVDNCLFTGEFIVDCTEADPYYPPNVYGFIAKCDDKSNIVFSNCLNAGKVEVKPVKNENQKFASICGTINKKVTLQNVYVTPDIASIAIGKLGRYATQEGNVIIVEKEQILGTAASSLMQLDFENYWTIRENNVPGLKTFCR